MQMASNSVPKNRAKSAAVPIAPSEVTARIRRTLDGLVIPQNRLCEQGNALETLDCAREVMELLAALDNFRNSNSGIPFEMPETGKFAMAMINQMAQDAIKYAATLCDAEDNLRGAFDRGQMESVTALEVQP
jgi:hypothetical protein